MATNTKGKSTKKTHTRQAAKSSYSREYEEYDEQEGRRSHKESRKEAKRRKKAKRKKRLILILVAEAFLLLVLGVCVWGVSKLNKLQDLDVNAEDVSINEDMDADTAALLKEYTNIALFGLGSRTPGSLGKGELSDTIIIASINNKTKEVRMVSVYRDTYLNRADDSYGKANAAYSRGGPKQAMEMLNTCLDLNIQYYVSVDFQALVRTINLLGGVEIDVQDNEWEKVNDYLYETTEIVQKSDMDYDDTHSDFLTGPGLQTLDGLQATAYCRIRKGAGDDYQRTVRQRTVIEQIVTKAKSAGLGTISEMIDEVFPLTATNIPKTTLVSMAASMMSYELGETTGFPTLREDNQKMDGQSVVIPADLETNVKLLHEFLFDETDYYPSPTVIKINDKIVADTGVTAQEVTEETTEETTEESSE